MENIGVLKFQQNSKNTYIYEVSGKKYNDIVWGKRTFRKVNFLLYNESIFLYFS